MISFGEITERVSALPDFTVMGGGEPATSRPVLKRTHNRLFCVMMVYGADYESIPRGYVFVDMETGTASYLNVADAMEYMEMPDSVLYGEREYDIPVDFSEDPNETDEIALFSDCINGDELDEAAYDHYVNVVIATARPEARRFYRWFMM
ncbi:MAG: hypothetical protein J6N76_04060 [Lachnospiraceae bacterium]|nr:hypothetical protein [Lachnospiraceae bacterium]